MKLSAILWHFLFFLVLVALSLIFHTEFHSTFVTTLFTCSALSTEEKAAIVIQTRFRGMKERRAFKERYGKTVCDIDCAAAAAAAAAAATKMAHTRHASSVGTRSAGPSASWRKEPGSTPIRVTSLPHGTGVRRPHLAPERAACRRVRVGLKLRPRRRRQRSQLLLLAGIMPRVAMCRASTRRAMSGAIASGVCPWQRVLARQARTSQSRWKSR